MFSLYLLHFLFLSPSLFFESSFFIPLSFDFDCKYSFLYHIPQYISLISFCFVILYAYNLYSINLVILLFIFSPFISHPGFFVYLWCVVVLADPGVHLVVRDGAPEGGLAVHDRLQLQGGQWAGARDQRVGGGGGRGQGGGLLGRILLHALALRGGVPIGVLGEVAGGGGGRGRRTRQVAQAVTEIEQVVYGILRAVPYKCRQSRCAMEDSQFQPGS